MTTTKINKKRTSWNKGKGDYMEVSKSDKKNKYRISSFKKL